MAKEMTIHSYTHGGVEGARPRQPMVHLLGTNGYGDTISITFHPDDAPAVAKAILGAGRSAKAGRHRNPVKIEFKPHG